MRVLACGVEREAVARRFVLADRRARFDCVWDQPVVDDLECRDVGGILDGLIHGSLIAQFPVVAHVVGNIVVDLGRAIRVCSIQMYIGRQDLVIGVHHFGRIASFGKCVGNDDGHVFTDLVDLALCQGRVWWRLHGVAILVSHHPTTDQATDFIGSEVIAGEHSEHTGRSSGLRRIHFVDLGVGMG